MRKTILALLFFAFTFSLANAQNEDYKFTGTVSVGGTLIGSVVRLVDGIVPAESTVNINVTPAFQGSFDYGINKFISVGAAVSNQNFSFDVDNYSYQIGERTVTEDFKADINRVSIALRPLFHYANNDKFDMYSGVRLQILRISFDADTTDPNFNFDEIKVLSSGTRFGLGIVAYGIRYYITENIGVGAEINIGAPYIANFGVSARF